MRIRSFNRSPAPLVAAFALVVAILVSGSAAGEDDGVSSRAAPKGKPKHYALNVTAPVTTTALITRTVPRGKTFLLYDIIFQNPAADVGRIQLRRGNETLLNLALQTFRAQHFTLQAPIAFRRAKKIGLFIDCDNPSGGCTPAALLSGVLRR